VKTRNGGGRGPVPPFLPVASPPGIAWAGTMETTSILVLFVTYSITLSSSRFIHTTNVHTTSTLD
jgi:hypothetical protein